MVKISNNEEGFSLLELAMAIGLMGIMTLIVGLNTIPTAMGTAQKANMRSDVMAMSIELQGWNLNNPNSEPSASEWEQMKLRVLEDEVNTKLQYLQSMTFVKLDNYYCVEVSAEVNNALFTTHYYGLTGKYLDSPCPLLPGKENF